MAAPGILVFPGVPFLLDSYHLSRVREEETIIIVHVCEVGATWEVQILCISVTHVDCVKSSFTLLETGIFSVLLGIAFGLHFSVNSEGDLCSLSLLNRIVAPMSHSKEMFRVPFFILTCFGRALACVTLFNSLGWSAWGVSVPLTPPCWSPG